MHRALGLPLFIAALLLAQAAHGQGGAPVTWRALYTGQLADRQVTLDLSLSDGDFAFGRLLLGGPGTVLDGVGTHLQEDGSVRLEFTEARPLAATSVALDLAYYGREDEQARPAPAATLEGNRNIDWQDDGDELEVTLRLQRGAGDGEVLRGSLVRVAQYAFHQLVEGRIRTGYAVPRFVGDAGALGARLLAMAEERAADRTAEGRQISDDGEGLGWGWSHEEATDLMGAAGPYRSLVTTFYYYTGGAHPNSHTESMLVSLEGAGTDPIPLSELFLPGTPWLEQVNGAVLEELGRQGADAVTSGSITGFGEEELATFSLGPAGLTFYFDPYVVGPYVQGRFLATVGYAELAPYAEPGGALHAFATLHGAY